MLCPQSGQVGSIKTRTLCIHHSTIWPFNLYNRLSAIINPNQKPRRTPLALFITITGTLCILRKANIMNSGFAASHHRWFWCLAPPGGRLWHAALFPRVLSCELPVSCDLQLPQESATNTCRFDIGEPGLRPRVCSDRLDNTSHVRRNRCVELISRFNLCSDANRHNFNFNSSKELFRTQKLMSYKKTMLFFLMIL